MISIDDFIENAVSEQIPIITEIYSIIKEEFPYLNEQISYGIPFFYHFGPLCYINPRKKVVDLGFTKGFALSNKQGILESKNRVQVCTISFNSVHEIQKELIVEILNEAISLNELLYYAKKGR